MTPPLAPFSTSSPDEDAPGAPAAPVTDPFAAPPPGAAQHSGSKHLEVDEAEIPTVDAVEAGPRGQRRRPTGGGRAGGGAGGGGAGGGAGGRNRNRRSRSRSRG